MYDPEQLDELHTRLEDGVTRALADGDYQSAARHAYAIDALKKWQASSFEGPPPADAQELSGMELTPLPEEPPGLPDASPPDEPASFDLDLDALLPPDEETLAAQLANGQEALAEGRTDYTISAFDAVADQAQSPDLHMAAVTALVQAQQAQLAATPAGAAAAGLAGFDPGLERRLRRSSLLSGLISALAMAMLLLMGGWLLARSLEPTAEELALAATEQARAIQSAVADSFAVQQETADARATVAAQATQAAADATATADAREMADATATAFYAPTATVIAEATATAEALAREISDDFAVIWPSEGVSMAVPPWEFVIQTSQPDWPAGTYTLLLDGQPIYEFSDPVAGAPLVYTRSIEDRYDGWPGVSEEVKQALGIQANGELPAGTYQLQVSFDTNGDRQADYVSQTVSFVIDPATRSWAVVWNAGNTGRARLQAPGAQPGEFMGQGIRDNEFVEILGKVEAMIYDQPKVWYFWQASASPDPIRGFERRGWTEAEFFRLESGKTLDDVPFLALPPAAG